MRKLILAYLRGDEPRVLWDARYWPMPQDPALAEGEPFPASDSGAEPLPEVPEPTAETVAP